MIEELFIIKDGVRERCDLSTPSGITLSYESNIFNALDKVNCSRSYTFSLPKTTRNKNILGAADDIRSEVAVTGIRMKAEFLVNGVNICPNANIYLSSADTVYKAVMTWNVVEGFENIKNNDISINQLETEDEKQSVTEQTFYGGESNPTSDLVKTAAYICGGGLRIFVPHNETTYSLPAVSTLKIIERINQWYGTRLFVDDAGNLVDGVVEHAFYDYVNTELVDGHLLADGCIPCIDAKLRKEQCKNLNLRLTSLYMNSNGYLGFHCTNNSRGNIIADNFSFKPVQTYWGSDQDVTYNLEIDVTISLYGSNGAEPIFLELYKVDYFGNEESILMLESEYTDNIFGGRIYDHKWKCGGEDRAPKSIEVAFGDDVQAIKMRFVDKKENGDVTRSLTIQNDSYINIYPEFGAGYSLPPMDVIYSLPDISCLTLLKSLFIMMGAFPKVGNNGNIYPCFHSDIFTNAENGVVYDWSSKLINPTDNPKEVYWKVGDFAQHNYYCMSTDKPMEAKSDNEDEDKYSESIIDVQVNNSLLDKEKVVFKLPFAAPFERDAKCPELYTGYTFKRWSFEDGKRTVTEGKAIYGLASPIELLGDNWAIWLLGNMSCWSLNYYSKGVRSLQKLVNDVRVMKCEMRLDEVTLNTLDYARPVYLSQYASYFAIIKIQRKSDGMCEAELIRLNFE